MCSAHWREASSVILAVINPKISSSKVTNFKVLFLKRSAVSKFMPNGYVFPGGVIEEQDSKHEWSELFKSFKIEKNHFRNILKRSSELPPLYKNIDGRIDKLVSLRISGIRETFEETGILLCRKTLDSSDLDSPQWANFMLIKDADKWRSKVHNNPSEFLNLCYENQCFPDVWGLNIWSDWLTPRTENKKRFDTAFFFAALKELPESLADQAEIVKSAWFTPEQALKQHEDGEIWLPPPQYYELNRMKQFNKLQDLVKFAAERNSQGVELWMPELVAVNDGVVSVFPGDDKYPKKPDFSTGDDMNVSDVSHEEYRQDCKSLHRIEIVQGKYNIIVSNVQAKFGHVLPTNTSKSQL